MANQGEVSLNELKNLIDSAREFLGPMWVKKSMKAASNLPVKGLIKRSQLKDIHPLGLVFKEVDKELDNISRGKPLTNAATLLMVAGLGRNLQALERDAHFAALIEALKTPSRFAQASLLAEVAAHWQTLGYQIALSPLEGEEEPELTVRACGDAGRITLAACLHIPGETSKSEVPPELPANFIFSDWWEPWVSDLAEFMADQDTQADELVSNYTRRDDLERPTVLYLDLPPFTEKEQLLPVLATAARAMGESAQSLAAVIICLPQYLPNLYVRHTLPVYAPDCPFPLPKSLLNALSY